MTLRPYHSEDCPLLASLFFDTVHTINRKDYTPSQLDVWATGNVDIAAWNQSLTAHHTIIAEINSVIVGFGDIDDSGYLDRLYVHKDYQGQGIASSIVNDLEQYSLTCGASRISTYASITANPFFLNRGYHTLRENIVLRGNVELINYYMEKELY